MINRNPVTTGDGPDLVGPYDRVEAEEPWFLPDETDEDSSPLPKAPEAGLVPTADWREAEAGLAAELADCAFDAGRLAERLRRAGQGAVQRLALEEAAAVSWWTGDRIGADRLALWLSWRIGAAEKGGEALVRTAWAARRLAAPPSAGVGATVADLLGEAGRGDAGFAGDVAAALAGVADLSPLVRGCAGFHLWRSLDERPEHLRGLEAAVLGARLAGQGRRLAFLPLALTGFGALTASGPPERRLAAWMQGAHRAVLAALMTLERVEVWRQLATAETDDLQGRTPARLVAALAAHPLLGAAEAEAETDASRAAVLRNLDLLQQRGLIREVTGQGRFRVWAAKV
ncbi:hypothetical protein [Tabrizicola sp.]|uniref:hypothetical protein n=1 Tax=Tabrizicola sp. TaxID=2005166 RepID=UPI002FDEFCE9